MKINALQLGNTNWKDEYNLPSVVDWNYNQSLSEMPKETFDIVFLDKTPSKSEIEILMDCTKAYCLFVTDKFELTGDVRRFYKSRVGKKLEKKDIQNFLTHELKNFYPKPYGEKFKLQNISVAQSYKGTVKWHGNISVELNSDYGEEYNQVVYWRNNIPIETGQTIEFWLEYEKDENVDLKLIITQYISGAIDFVDEKVEFEGDMLNDVIRLENNGKTGMLSISLHAKGEGLLKVIALHDRFSRRGYGHFIPGGIRKVTKDREEVFFYFDPGDLKPPLNVYFSGYKTKEGFEGYNLMRSMGSPFLLVSEARLEGGSFYMGSEEYEKMISDEISKYIYKLNFTADQVILSGISMGTTGALYYACDIWPHAVIIGKPITRIGTVARAESISRPGGFPTSLDVVMKLQGKSSVEEANNLDERFWTKFKEGYWNNTKFIVSYMIEDDYDKGAYDKLISSINQKGVEVYGKGIHGRHNDNTRSIVAWFKSQFDKVLLEDFGRDNQK